MSNLAACVLGAATIVTTGMLCGCAPRGDAEMIGHTTHVLDSATINRFFLRNPLPDDAPQRVSPLLDSAQFSLHVSRVHTSDARHVHIDHDLTLFVHRGVGEVFVNDRRRRVGPGDVLHIPRGVPHYSVNKTKLPLTLVLLFTPPMHTNDTIDFPADAESYPRPP